MDDVPGRNREPLIWEAVGRDADTWESGADALVQLVLELRLARSRADLAQPVIVF
jgi:hypothetical protein